MASITGTPGNDVLFGDPAGVPENDTITGLDGNDLLLGLDGDDEIDGGAGNDFAFGDAGNDTLLGGLGDDQLDGVGGNDTLAGGAGHDHLDGGTGNDTLDRGTGADHLDGGLRGNDTFIVDDLGDVVVETGFGVDEVFSSVTFSLLGQPVENLWLTGAAAIDGTGNGLGNHIAGNAAANRLDGGAGGDVLLGGVGSDALLGGLGADSLFGGLNADVLIGGLGKDRLWGDLGADRFDFDVVAGTTPGSANRDAIFDFSQALGDRIDLSGIDANSGIAGDQAFSFIGGAAFSGAAGELRTAVIVGASWQNTLIQGDKNGDGAADLEIALIDFSPVLSAAAFLL